VQLPGGHSHPPHGGHFNHSPGGHSYQHPEDQSYHPPGGHSYQPPASPHVAPHIQVPPRTLNTVRPSHNTPVSTVRPAYHTTPSPLGHLKGHSPTPHPSYNPDLGYQYSTPHSFVKVQHGGTFPLSDLKVGENIHGYSTTPNPYTSGLKQVELVGPVPVKANGPLTLQILPSPKPLRVQKIFVENPSVANGLRVAKSVGTGLKYEKGPSLHFEDDNGGVRRESSISVKEDSASGFREINSQEKNPQHAQYVREKKDVGLAGGLAGGHPGGQPGYAPAEQVPTSTQAAIIFAESQKMIRFPEDK